MTTDTFLNTFDTLLGCDQLEDSLSSQYYDDSKVVDNVEERQADLCEILLNQLTEHYHDGTNQTGNTENDHDKENDNNENDDDNDDCTDESSIAMDVSSPRSRTSHATMESNKSSANHSHNPSLRTLFGGPSRKVSDIVPVLANLLSNRRETQSLMPATQDFEANEEVSSESTPSALSLTVPSMQAARLYAYLLSQPGALGSGLVDMEPLTALLALIRRWTMECCGREMKVLSTGGSCNKPLYNTSNSTERGSPTKSPPLKRTKRTGRSGDKTSDDKENTCDDDSYEHDDDGNTGSVVKDSQGLVLGLGIDVAMKICDIPQQREFASWSSDAREVVIDAVVSALATTAALASGINKKKNFQMQMEQHSDVLSKVADEAVRGLEACISHSMHGISSSQRHETVVFTMRGLLRLLQLDTVLPVGERGKMAARDVAGRALTSLMESTIVGKNPSAPANTTTPSRGRSIRRLSGGKTPGTTRSKSRSRRSSLDGRTSLLSPALKKKGEGRVSLSRDTITTPLPPSHRADRPRGITAIFLSILQKLLAGKGLERQTLRKPTVETVCSCLTWIQLEERSHLLRYVLKLGNSKISSHRLVACELIGALLSEADWLDEHQADFVDVDDDLDILLSPPGEGDISTRTPAKGSVADRSTTPDTISSSKPNSNRSIIDAILLCLKGRLIDRAAAVRASAASALKLSVLQNVERIRSLDFAQPSKEYDESLFDALRSRIVLDESATVRKSSVEALTHLLLASPADLIYNDNIQPISELCHDKSLIVRKAAADCLTMLLDNRSTDRAIRTSYFAPEDVVEEAWVNNVLPMVLDDETRSKAVEVFYQVIVGPLVEEQMRETSVSLAFRLMTVVARSNYNRGGSKVPQQALQSAVSSLGQIHPNPDEIYVSLVNRTAEIASQSVIDEDMSESKVIGAWSMLEALLSGRKASFSLMKYLGSTSGKMSFCGSAWKTLLKHSAEESPANWIQIVLKSSLVVLSKIASMLGEDEIEKCTRDLGDALQDFCFAPDQMTAAIDALTALTIAWYKGKSAIIVQGACTAWIEKIAYRCETEISAFVQRADRNEGSVSEQQQKRLTKALFTIGQLVMIGFSADEDEASSAFQSSSDTNKTDSLRGFRFTPSKKLSELVQIMVDHCLPGKSKAKTPTFARAHAFLVLGKLCLRDETFARESLTIFAQELHPSNPDPVPSVQSNALLVLGDLCVRYTNMTDRYLPVMAACMQLGVSGADSIPLFSSPSGIVRKHAVLLLSSLLLKDYIKFRGLLFHRMLVATSDEDEEVASLAEGVLSGPLFLRYPKLFSNNFVESVFVLNKCTAHPVYVSAARQGDGGSGIAVGFDGINLDGEVGRLRRQSMYNFLLAKLSDEEKISVAARLAKEVLASAVEETGDLGAVCIVADSADLNPRLIGAWNVVLDTFYVLTNKALKVGSLPEGSDSVEDPTMPNTARHVTVARSRLLSNISRKHLIEIVLPILCNLKVKLQSNQSPLLKDLMSYLVHIFKYYKTEAKEFLANDPTLLQEIEYDARQHAMSLSQSEP